MIYKQCAKYKDELTELVCITLKCCGNRYTDDCLQDIYIEAMNVYIGSKFTPPEFKKKLFKCF